MPAASSEVWTSSGFRLTGTALLIGNVVAFSAFLILRRHSHYDSFWDVWMAAAGMLVPTVACFGRAVLGGPRRAAALWLGVGMLSWTAGNVTFVGWTQFQTHPPVPSPADIAYLGFYVCVVAAMVSLARHDARSLARSLWLDGALGGAGAATALAVVLNSVLTSAGGGISHVLVSAAYTFADLVLVVMICGVLAVRGARGGSLWLWLAGGLAVFCATDVVYALQVQSGTFVTGALLSGLWSLGITIVAYSIWRPEHPMPIEARRSAAVLAVPMLATATAVIVLVAASRREFSPIVIALATITLLLAAVRTFVSFGQVQRLSDARRQALTDELTGLGNRRFLLEDGERRINVAGPDDRIALLIIDLDDFKVVNDALGHNAGDALLREVGRRLGARVREPDLLVRLAGDAFALVVTLAPDADGVQLTEEILDRICRSLVVDGARLRIEASAGVAVGAGSSVTMAELVRRADLAMFAAKAAGVRVRLYDPKLDEANLRLLETAQDLDSALAHREFILHFQPKIDVQSGAAIGAEALVRWQHPTRGLLYPDAFLPVVERNGLMGSLTRIVLEAAIAQIAAWRLADLRITVAVNLSASDLLDEQLADRIARLLVEYAVPVSALELEITEGVLMTDPDRAHRVLARLRRLGLRIAVDDYGTGYSTLTYLRDLPIDEIKIDRSFVADITTDRRSAAIVRSTIELAHALELKVVAEGVEHDHILGALAELGCDYAQGYHFSTPLPAEAFASWARVRELDPAPPGARRPLALFP